MWDEIQDMPGEIFDIDVAREEEETFLDICFDLMMVVLFGEMPLKQKHIVLWMRRTTDDNK